MLACRERAVGTRKQLSSWTWARAKQMLARDHVTYIFASVSFIMIIDKESRLKKTITREIYSLLMDHWFALWLLCVVY